MPTTQKRLAIRQTGLFSAMPRETNARLVARSNVRSAARGKPLFQQGDQAESAIVIPDGCAKLFRMSPTGAKQVVTVFTRENALGEGATFVGGAYPAADRLITDPRQRSVRTAAIPGLKDRNRAPCHAMIAATVIADPCSLLEHSYVERAAAWSREA